MWSNWIALCCLHCLIGIVVTLDCQRSRKEWMRIRYTSTPGTHPPSLGSAQICPVQESPSCCDTQIEREMYALGQRRLYDQAGMNWLQVAEQMNNDSVALEYFFRSDLEQARNRLHQFFSRIYGYNYKLHRRFFFQFFADLEAYIAGHRGQLDQLIDQFFHQLRDNIVSLVERSGQMASAAASSSSVAAAFGGSSRSDFSMPQMDAPVGAGAAPSSSTGRGEGNSDATDAQRIRCLSDQVAKLRPFDDVDVRLKARMLEAYPPARMLVNVLAVTSRLLSQLANQVSDRPECVLGMTRIQFCPICAGRPVSSVCPDSCTQLMSGCLHATGLEQAHQLRTIWPRLIEAVGMATVRLERSFNLPAVNRHLQMEISEAITSLQTRYEQTKSKFQSECRSDTKSRAVPTLFRSTGPNYHPSPQSPGGWPPNPSAPNSVTHRLRRSRRQARSNSPSGGYASPELLDWQTRQQPGHPTGPFSSNPWGSFGPVQPAAVGHQQLQQQQTYRNQQPHLPPRQPHQMAYANQEAYGFRQPQQQAPPQRNEAAPVGEGQSDVPEKLMRWASQLKRSYAQLSNLFADPGANFCSSDAHASVNASRGSPNCWQPPKLPSSMASPRGLIETYRLLSDAVERLRQAAANNADPDALNVPMPKQAPQLPTGPGTHGDGGRFGAPLRASSSGAVAPSAPDSAAYQPGPNGWNPPVANPSAFAPPYEPIAPDGLVGSGMNPLEWNKSPPPNGQNHALPLPQQPGNYLNERPINQPQQPWNMNNPMVPPPPHPSYESAGPNPQAPGNAMAGSGYDFYQPPPPPYEGGNEDSRDQWASQSTIEPFSSSSTLESTSTMKPTTEPVITTLYATEPAVTTTIPPVYQTTIPTTVAKSSTTTTKATTVESESTTTTTITTTLHQQPSHPPVVVPPGKPDWLSPETLDRSIVTTTTTLAPAPQPTPSGGMVSSKPAEPLFPYGHLPDDEDSVAQPSPPPHNFNQPSGTYRQPTRQPGTQHPPNGIQQPPPPSWPEAPGQPPPDPESQGAWWEKPYAENSGFAAAPTGPTGSQHNYPSPPNKPMDPNAPPPIAPYPDAGSGILMPPMRPGENTLNGNYPPFNQPSQGAVEHPGGLYQPTSWSDPVQQPPMQASGLANGAWTNENNPNWGDGTVDWQGRLQGSGTAESIDQPIDVAPSPHRPTDTVPGPPVVPPPALKPEQPNAVPHLPLPPPEVWVPAKLAPGQPLSSIFLVREYNMQGPFYGPETMQTRPSCACLANPMLFCAIFALLLHYLVQRIY